MVGWPEAPDSPLHSGGAPGAAGAGTAAAGGAVGDAAAGGAGRTDPVVPPPNRFHGNPLAWPSAGPAAVSMTTTAPQSAEDRNRSCFDIENHAIRVTSRVLWGPL